ncbi:tetratricopeptide repeat protein [Undibacterium sp. TJN19]|uniref:tetratricopeptide repeat protein n=1 Tax=Undibacterium sp. TJN19 TaxID=3413055 RepID=UPI003BF43D5A
MSGVVKRTQKFVIFLLVCLMGSAVARADENTDNENLYIEALKAISEKRHDDAKVLLNKLIGKLPQHGGALMDLAMLHCELGNKVEADRIFHDMKASFQLSEDQVHELDLLQSKKCLPRAPETRIAISFDVGYDTNVNQGASNPDFILGSGTEQLELRLLPEYQPKADRYATLTANGSRELSNKGLVGFAQLRVRAYDTLTAFNTMAAAAGVEQAWNWRDYGFRSTGLLSALTLGGQLYQKQEIVQLRLTPPAKADSPWRFSTAAGFTNVQYPTLSNFDAHTWELRGMLSYEAEKFLLQGSIAYLADRAHSDRQGGHRQGYYANLNLRRQLFQRHELELGWSQQLWQSADIYSPTLIDVARRQDTQMFKAALNWAMTDKQTLQLEFRATNNRENISILQYNGKSLQLSWQWQNF